MPNLDPADLVRDCPVANFSGAWPLPVQARLEALVQQATDEGERTSGRELLAAIVCAFSPESTGLHEVLRAYRTSVVGDVLLTETPADNVVRLERRGPGRPASRRL